MNDVMEQAKELYEYKQDFNLIRDIIKIYDTNITYDEYKQKDIKRIEQECEEQKQQGLTHYQVRILTEQQFQIIKIIKSMKEHDISFDDMVII